MTCFLDFEYDGKYLSDFGFVICRIDTDDMETVSAGSAITFSKVSRNSGKQYSLTSTRYDECIQAEFEICKDPDLYKDRNEQFITNDEYRTLMRWLNRREFLRFRVFEYEDEEYHDKCYYNASFNVEKINAEGKLFGLRLVMESDKPFGYGEKQVVNWSFTDADDVKILNDMSDEIGYIYPDLTITCKAEGDITISNPQTGCNTVIKNCSVGEIIKLYGETQVISSNRNSHDIANDFNYEFFKIGNTIDSRQNHISVSIPCDLLIEYCPIIKDIP